MRHLAEWFPAFLTDAAGALPLGQAVDMIYTDVFMHRGDLARATGQDETLDPRTA